MTGITHLYVRYVKPIAEPQTVILQRGQEKYIDLKKLLIQGANPQSPAVHEKFNNFQGGYRCEIVITSQPSKGNAWIDDYKMGLRYKAGPGFVYGMDSFSYRLVNPFGQESDSQCVYLFIANSIP